MGATETAAWIFFFVVLVQHQGHCVKVLVFQENGIPNEEDAAKLELSKQNLTIKPQPAVDHNFEGILYTKSLTLCYRAWIFYFRIKTSPVSYAVSTAFANEIYSDMSPYQVGFALFSSFFSAVMSLEQNEWYHICLWFDDASSVRRIYVQGKMVAEEEFKSARPLYLNGTIVLGQEQDSPGGDFDWYQSISGKITQVNFWSRALEPEEISALSQCSSDLQGDIVSWNEAPWQMISNVSEKMLALESFCYPKEKPYFIIFPEPRTIKESRYLCKILGAELAIPSNERQNLKLTESAEQFAESCSARGALWLGIQDEVSEGKWSTFPQKSENQGLLWNYLAFRSRQPDGGRTENCAILELLRGGWSDWKCGTSSQFCTACMSENPVRFTLRGLCDMNMFQYQFMLEGYMNNKPFWRGLHKYQIEFRDSEWILRDLFTSVTLATKYASEPTVYPIGVSAWKILANRAICAAKAGDYHTLSLTSCKHTTEFTCNDGSCISSNHRCNLRKDCTDGSDENGCETVILDHGYLPELPPPPTNHSPQSVPIGLNVYMDRLTRIDTYNMEVDLDFTLNLSWMDPRVLFLNLKFPPKINIVQVRDGQELWRPLLSFPSGNDVLRIHLETFTVTRTGPPLPDDLSRPFQDQVFGGEDGTLSFMWKTAMPFSCNFLLHYYPFDVQVCQIPVVMSSASVEFLNFGNLSIDYLGERMLTEVEVGEVSLVHRPNTTQPTVDMRVELKRRNSFHVMTTYLPTLLLIIVGYSSLFIKLDMFSVRSVMALTTLLVLTALYTQTAASLPKTSYLKAVDIWYLYCIIALVVIIITHVFTNYLDDVHTYMKMVSSLDREEIYHILLLNCLNDFTCDGIITIMRIMIFLSFIIFNIIYWSIVLG